MQQQQMFQIIKAKKLCRKTRESKIALSENGEFLTKNNKIAKTFNSFLRQSLIHFIYLFGLQKLMFVMISSTNHTQFFKPL